MSRGLLLRQQVLHLDHVSLPPGDPGSLVQHWVSPSADWAGRRSFVT